MNKNQYHLYALFEGFVRNIFEVFLIGLANNRNFLTYQYLNQLKQQHATSNERTALLAEINSLLTKHALRAGYQLGQSNPQDFLYRVSVAEQGDLIIREEIRSSQKNAMEVRSNRINVFGADPFVSYACPAQGIRCVIFGEDQKTAILTIVRDQQAAKNLARAFSYLIRNIQRG